MNRKFWLALTNNAISSPYRTVLVLQRSTIKEKLEIIRSLAENILALLKEKADIVREIEDVDLFQTRVKMVLVKVGEVFSFVVSIDVGPVAMTSEEPSYEIDANENMQKVSPLNISSVTPQGAQIKLPKLELNEFNGDITKWCAFLDMFEAAIHNNPSLANY